MIKKLTGKITSITDISNTAKEIGIALPEPLNFIPGSFVNVFINISGEKIRRAYSISSSSNNQQDITITVRLSPAGTVTPLFWKENMVGQTIEIMGPLGLNTADKMISNKKFLFAFGVGAGVVKSLADYFSTVNKVDSLTITTGSRREDEILYKEYFDNLAHTSQNTTIIHVVSEVQEGSQNLKGYIQDHIDAFDFNNSDIYVCGQERACNELVAKVSSMNPTGCNFFIEAFH